MGFSGDGDATGIAAGHTTARTYRPEAQEDLAGEISVSTSLRRLFAGNRVKSDMGISPII